MASRVVTSLCQKHTCGIQVGRLILLGRKIGQRSRNLADLSRSRNSAGLCTASFARTSSAPSSSVIETESDKNVSLPSMDLPPPLPVSDSYRLTPSFDARRVDPTTVKQVFYFDTLSLARRLEKNGFTRMEAEGLVEGLVDLVNATLDHQSRHMVTKAQQEIVVQQMMAEISSVKKEMVILQKSEFSSLCNETEKQSIEIKHLKSLLNDEISKLKSQMKLDINLERGRAIEAHAESERQIQKIHNKIDTDVANLRTTFEVYRNDVFKYAAGTVLTCSTICLGIIRLWS